MQMTTFDLNAAIVEEVAAYETSVAAKQTQRERQQAEEREREQQRRDEKIATCADQLREDLGNDLYAALAITVTWATYGPQATATIDGEAWTITYTNAPAPKHWYISRVVGLGGDATRAGLRSVVLRAIAQERELRAQQAQQQAQQEAERQARRAEHERCQAHLNDALVAARAALWTWPEGYILTLYRWTWHIGDGNFEDAWAVSDRLDTQGYAEFYNEGRVQMLRLGMQAHQPVIERRTFHGIDTLPGELREHVRIDVPGIWWEYSEDLYRADPEASMTHDVGTVPCAWVRAQFTSESPS